MARSLRFCMVTTFYPPYNFGGDGIFVHRLANRLADMGHRVDVIHCRDAYRLCARENTQHVYEDHPNVTVHGLESPFGPLSPLATHQTGFPFFKARSLRRIMEKDFDVIHFHNISLAGGPKILEYGRGIKLYTAHEYWLFCPMHLLYSWKQAPCLHPRLCAVCCLAQGVPPQWWRALGLMERYVRHLDALICPSKFCRDLYQKRLPGLPVVHIPIFSSQERGDPACDPGWKPPAPYFLFVGRLEKIKGLQSLIPVFRRHRGAPLLVAGSGSHEAKLKSLAQGCEAIQFLGRQSGPRLRALYRHAVALIVPSLCFEIFGTVIIEAFSEGTPVIVQDQGGMPELVRESGGGYVYGSDEELVAAMDSLLHDEEHRRSLGYAALNSYREKWTAEKHLDAYLALIEELTVRKNN